MAVQTIGTAPVRTSRPAYLRQTGALFIVGGLLMAVGGGLHPRGSGATGRSRAAWASAALGVIGGLLSGAAAPTVVLTGDPAHAVLFAFQTGVAVWLVGTGVRLLRR